MAKKVRYRGMKEIPRLHGKLRDIQGQLFQVRGFVDGMVVLRAIGGRWGTKTSPRGSHAYSVEYPEIIKEYFYLPRMWNGKTRRPETTLAQLA